MLRFKNQNKMKIKTIGYMPLFYGREYLRESLLSIINHVDEFVILYTPVPSHGHHTDAPCPETEDELIKIALEVCGSKLIWHKNTYANEGEQRSYIYNYTKDRDFQLILAVDADEIFKEDELTKALQLAYGGDKRYYGISGYLNFWKSFSNVLTDGFTPIRITNLKNESGEGVVPCTIYHFSCAQSDETMKFKYKIHGHADEIRSGWLDNIYFAWQPNNQLKQLHPTSIDIWGEVQPFDKNTLPDSLKQHPNFNKEII